MRCTKCHYLSFEPEPRCRNCGHDLGLDELTLSFDEPADAAQANAERGAQVSGGVATMTEVAAPPVRPRPVAPAAPAAATVVKIAIPPPTTELPLFVREVPAAADLAIDDEIDLAPLVDVPARPRAPLAVRKTTPDPARLRAKYAMPQEPDLLAEIDDPTGAPLRPTPMIDAPILHPAEPEPVVEAPVTPMPTVATGARLAAALIDAVVLGTLATAIVMLTLRTADLSWSQVSVLPVIPMLAFFALIGVGYEAMFTAANGQTVGKMAVGLRVVSDETRDRVTLRQATIRAMSMLPLGAGILAALAGPGLATHDRIAHTRVVRM